MQRSQWRFTFDGTEYRYSGYVGAPDAILIKKHTGLGVLGVLHGIVTGDPEALVAMVFLAKRHAGEDVTWAELVESMVGENDLMALVESVEPIKDEPAKPKQRRKVVASELAPEEPTPAE